MDYIKKLYHLLIYLSRTAFDPPNNLFSGAIQAFIILVTEEFKIHSLKSDSRLVSTFAVIHKVGLGPSRVSEPI